MSNANIVLLTACGNIRPPDSYVGEKTQSACFLYTINATKKKKAPNTKTNGVMHA